MIACTERWAAATNNFDAVYSKKTAFTRGAGRDQFRPFPAKGKLGILIRAAVRHITGSLRKLGM
jgi:hypothetical protein